MSKIETNTIAPSTGTTLTLGESGDTVTLGSGATQSGFGGVNTPAFFVSKTSDQSITDATATKATFDTEDFDTGSAFASSRFTVPSGEAGKYFFFSTLRCKASSGTMDYTLFRFYKNGTNDLTPFQLNAATNQLKNSHIAGSAIYDLSVGDYIEVYVTISGTSPSIGGDSARVDRSFFGGYKIIE
jgi:hypothetical protein